MEFLTYKAIHLFGALLLLFALGGLTLRAMDARDAGKTAARKLGGMTHGIALLILLISGFGALAKLGTGGMPLWVWLKLVLWLAFGGVAVLIHKKPSLLRPLWLLLPLLGGVAAWVALYKPV